ncbi:hypothetical protein [Jiangella asiatica]|nr:hypothetical protein [Jiangella asiatica]
MPDPTDPPGFERIVRRIRIAVWLLVAFVALPLALWLVGRY